MPGIVERIKTEVPEKSVIPKPRTTQHRVKGWGMRRGERALIYHIPNSRKPACPDEKGVNVSEWEQAYDRLMSTGELSHAWFKRAMVGCSNEGSCNFTSIGGVFVLLSIAEYCGNGVYRKTE